MSSISIYLRYCIYRLVSNITGIKGSLRSMRTWWNIYILLFIFAIASYVKSGNQAYMHFIVLIFAMMVIVDVARDYRGGSHMHWWRTKHGKI